MGLLYNPLTKKVQPVAYVVLLLIPVIFIVALFVYGSKLPPKLESGETGFTANP